MMFLRFLSPRPRFYLIVIFGRIGQMPAVIG